MCGVIDLEEDFAQVELEENVDLNSLPKEHFIKLLVLGDLGVGKTSLLKNYTSMEQRPSVASGAVSNHAALDNLNLNSPMCEREEEKSDYKYVYHTYYRDRSEEGGYLFRFLLELPILIRFFIISRVSVDVGYHLKRLDLGDKQKVTIQLWDIPGNLRAID